MQLKKFSELEQVEAFTGTDIIPISRQLDDGRYESLRGDMDQLKAQIDYDLNVIDVMEVDPPEDTDNPVYLLIAGHKVLAYPYMDDVPTVTFPGNIPRIVLPLLGFRAAINVEYAIPFVVVNGEISSLSISSPLPDRFTVLSVVQESETTGYIKIKTNTYATGNVFTSVVVSDDTAGFSATITVYHEYPPTNISSQSISVSGNIITATWRFELPSAVQYYFGVIEPVITLDPDIPFKLSAGLNFFRQATVRRYNQTWVDLTTTIILSESYTGLVTVTCADIIHGFSAVASINVDYTL